MKDKAKKFIDEILICPDCKPNFDGKGGFQYCEKHWKILKETNWLEGALP